MTRLCPWKNGRELATAGKTGVSLSFDYDVDGLRTEKTVSSSNTHRYLYAGGLLLQDRYTRNSFIYELKFVYDANGRPFALVYTCDGYTTVYYYVLNAQGDVIRLVNGSGATIANYEYDPYGRLLSVKNANGSITNPTSIAHLNPLRYRSYYYDTETGWYYLQSRYYDPTLGRFLNADSYASTGQGFLGYNMFAYCNNYPVARSDPNGEFFATLVGAIGGAIGGFIGAAINGDDPLKGALIGAGTGALAGLAVDFAVATGGLGGVAIAVVGGAIASGIDSAANDIANGRSVDWGGAALSAGIGGVTNLLSFGLVDSSALKSGGNIIKNFVSNGTKQLVANTTRKVAGKVVSKTFVGVAKNVGKNILSNSVEAAIISGFNGVFKKGIQAAYQ